MFERLYKLPVKVLLFNSIDRAHQQQKMHANDFEYLGVKFTTPGLFIQDLFVISGASGKLIENTERLGILLGIYSSSENEFQNICSNGAISFLTEFIENVGDFETYNKRKDDILAGRIDVSGLERDVYKLSDEYFKFLDQSGEFIEACQFARQYAEIFKDKYDIKLVDNIDLKSYEYELFSEISISEINCDLPKIDESFEDIDLSLNVLSGVRAQFSAIRDQMDIIKANERVLFVVNDPVSAYEQVTSIANNINLDACISTTANVAIKDTFIGRALFGFAILISRTNDLENVSDFIASPYLDLDDRLCVKINSKLRSAEIVDISEIEEFLLKNCSDSYNNLMSFFDVSNTDKDISFKLFAQLDKVNPSTNINREIETSAIKAIRSVFDAYSKVTSDFDEGLVSAILEPKITISYSNMEIPITNQTNLTEIVISSSSSVKNFTSASFDRVICLDVSELSYSIKEPHRSIDTTFKSLGLHKMMTEYDKTKYDFIALADVFNKNTTPMTLYFLLRNIEEDEISVSFPMQELINSRYSSFNFEKIFESLSDNNVDYRTYGEDRIFESFGGVDKTFLGNFSEFSIGNSGVYAVDNIMDYIQTKDINGKTYPILSPSQIEKYLQCPYKWFIESCIRPSQIDRKFDSAFLGSFAHDTFKLIYDRAKDEGIERFYLNDDELIEKYVVEVLQDNIQDYLDNTSNHAETRKYPRMDKQDVLKLTQLKDGMVACIKQLSVLPNTMLVSKHESELSPNLNTIFGGCVIKGRIDRIDIDVENHTFCIIDYKSNTNNGYKLSDCINKSDEGNEIPQHVQAYIYAKCIAQNFSDEGLDVKPSGAVYASYKTKQLDENRIKGIITNNIVKEGIFPYAERFNIVDFENYLDELSNRVAPYVEELCCGNITPRPKKDICAYCSAKFCPARIN